jgi:hypothetical protein
MSRPAHLHWKAEDRDIFEIYAMMENDPARGEESGVIHKELNASVDHYLVPLSREGADPVSRFYRLKHEWEAATAHLSSIEEMAMHPAYQQIIGMGNASLPLIMREMKKRPGHWFWALKAITGADPVPPEKRGRIREMTEVWLFWLRQYEYLR